MIISIYWRIHEDSSAAGEEFIVICKGNNREVRSKKTELQAALSLWDH
jgi:hypothetical protein